MGKCRNADLCGIGGREEWNEQSCQKPVANSINYHNVCGESLTQCILDKAPSRVATIFSPLLAVHRSSETSHMIPSEGLVTHG